MINKAILKEFREDFNKAIKPLQEKYGFDIKLGKINYCDDSFDGKLQVFDKSKGESKEANEFEKYCHLYGLEKSDLGKTIVCNREEFIIVGLNPSKRKYCIQVVRLKDGKSFGLSLEATKDGLKRIAN